MERSIYFTNSKGNSLSGTLLTPGGTAPYPVVVFAHGLYSGKYSPRNLEVARDLNGRGIAAFLIDFTGHGESEGTLDESTIEQQVDDLFSAIGYLVQQTEIDGERIGVNGSSSGGTVAVICAAQDPRIKVLVLRSPRADGAIKAAYLVSAPTLIIAGERDLEVVEESHALLAALSGEKRLEIIREAGHLFERPDQLRRAIDLTVNWFTDRMQRRGIARAA